MGFVADEEVKSGGFVPDEPAAKPLPANAGLARFLTSAAGIPVDTAENVLNLGLAGVGTAATALGRPDLAPNLMRGSYGGSEYLQSLLRKTGMPGLSPDNPNPQDALGTAQYDFTARGGPLPGGAVPAAASMIAEKVGGPEWAAVGAMLPSAAKTGYNEMRAPSLQRQQAQNVVRDETLKRAHEEGYVTPPSQVNSTFLGNRLEGLSGKAALDQDSVIRNQQITNNIARREIGLAENAPITPQAIEARRVIISGPYKEVANLSASASKALERLRQARKDAKDYWAHYDRAADPKSQAEARKLDKQAEMLETFLEKEARRHGKPDLVDRMREARQELAKTYDVERSLNLGTGNVDAHILGRALDRGTPLTGGLETIAKFSQAYKPLTRDASGTPTPGVGALEWYGGAGLGAGGAALFGPAGAAMAALPLVRPGVRELLLSQAYQRRFARPDYAPFTPENEIQSLGRTAILENERARK